MELLKQLSELHKAKATFIEAHQDVVNQLKDLDDAIARVEQDIKIEARTQEKDMQHENVTVKVMPIYNVSYDYNKFSGAERTILKSHKAVSFHIDKDKIDDLVIEGLISPESRQKAFSETKGTTRVSIKVA